MPLSHRMLLGLTALLSVALLVLTASLSVAQEEDEPTWAVHAVPGGPALDLSAAAKPDDDEQVLYAAGNEAVTSTRGTDWTLAPGAGALVNIAAAAEGTVYAADAEGQGYRSTRYGRSWRKLNVRDDAPVRFVAVSPDYAFDGTAYAITVGEWRLYRTTNDARNWQEVTPEVDVENQIGAVGFSPLHRIDETVFIGSERGIYKWSADNRQWTMVSDADAAPAFGDGGGPLRSQGLVLPYEYGDDPARRNDPVLETVFAYNARGVYRSDDDARTWQAVELPSSVQQVNGLAVSNGWPADPVIMVAVAAPDVVAVVSLDNGQTWQEVPGTGGIVGTDVEMSIDFAPIPEPDEDWLTTLHLPVSAKGVPLGPPPTMVPPYIGSREAFVGTDGAGVLYTDDGGVTWNASPPTYQAVNVTALDMLPGGREAVVFAGSRQSGLFRSDDGGRTWRWTEAGLPRGAGEAILDIVVSPDVDADDTVFVVAESGVWVTRDRGDSFSRLDAPPGAVALDLSPGYASDRTLATTGAISRDDGATWAPLEPVTGTWTAVAFSAGWPDDDTMWAGTTDVEGDNRYGLYRKSPASEGRWETMVDSRLSRAGILTLCAVRFDPGEDPRIFVGTTRGLVASFDNGEDFDRVGPTSRGIHSITGRSITEPFVKGVVAAAGVDGAMWSSDRGVSFSREPRSDRPARGVALSDDGGALVIGLTTAVQRLVLEP